LRLRRRGRPVGEQRGGALEAGARELACASRPRERGEDQLRVGGSLDVAGGEQRVRGFDDHVLVAAHSVLDPGGSQQQTGTLGVVRRRQSERASIEPAGRRERVQRKRAVAGLAESPRRTEGDVFRQRDSGSLSELQRGHVVVREELGVILGTAERLDPLRGAEVLLGAGGARDLAVGDVPDEDVEERVLRVAGAGRASFPAEEVPPLEGVQLLLYGEPVAAGHECEPSRPERAADDGGILDQILRLGLEQVEPGGHDAVDGLRDGQLASGLAQHARILLGVEWVAAGARQQVGLCLREQDRPLEEVADQPGGFLVRQRRQ
jgi:hypothetical protein